LRKVPQFGTYRKKSILNFFDYPIGYSSKVLCAIGLPFTLYCLSWVLNALTLRVSLAMLKNMSCPKIGLHK
jgi:hypothetical protein